MTCSQANERMMQYFDNDINDLDLYHLKQHMKNCTYCSEQYRIMEEVIGYMEEQPLLDPPEDFQDNVMKAVQAAGNYKKYSLRMPLKLISILLGSLLFIITAWVMIILQNISVLELVRESVYGGSVWQVFNSIVEMFQNGYKTAVIIGDSIFNVYYILLKNYYDIMLSMGAIILIGCIMLSKVVRQQN